VKPAAQTPAFRALLEILRRHAGLVFPPGRQEVAAAAIRRAMEGAGVADAEAYHRLVAGDRGALDALLAEATVGETYFFRDAEQWEVARQAIREVAGRRGPGHVLRAWSAACSTGEEAYTLAIVCRELGLRRQILGTDISEPRLAVARAGRYGRWSLRDVPPATVGAWFARKGAIFELDPSLRTGVSFRALNLAAGDYPSVASGVWEMDVVFCRNVLIYFDAHAVAYAARRLVESLAPGGWLFTGASDPPISDHADCEVMVTAAGLAYRRPLERGAWSPGPSPSPFPELPQPTAWPARPNPSAAFPSSAAPLDRGPAAGSPSAGSGSGSGGLGWDSTASTSAGSTSAGSAWGGSGSARSTSEGASQSGSTPAGSAWGGSGSDSVASTSTGSASAGAPGGGATRTADARDGVPSIRAVDGTASTGTVAGSLPSGDGRRGVDETDRSREMGSDADRVAREGVAGLEEVERRYERRDYAGAAEAARRRLAGGADEARAWELLVRALANRGALDEAEAACAEALDRHRGSAALYHLRGVLLDEGGRHAEAAAAARQALYLDPDLTVAWLLLASAATRLGSADAARRALRNAERLLSALAPGAAVPGADGETAGHLLRGVRMRAALLPGGGA
jgi:chemotaxis protein methyltransferase CheR